MTVEPYAEIEGSGRTGPSRAILLYGGRFASVHAIERGELAPGRALSSEALREALEALCGASLEWLPANVLAFGAGRLVWCEPPQTRALFFETGDAALDSLSGRAFPVPGLVFAASARSLCVWAYRGEHRPESNEDLFVAPFFNVARGSVCLGSMRVPEVFDAGCGEAWSASFFAAAFTHQTQPGALTSFGGSQAELWLESGRRGAFDPAWLVPANTVLEAAIRRE